MELEQPVGCPVCASMYVKSLARDRGWHETIHQKCLIAIEKYGFFWSDWEEIKTETYLSLGAEREHLSFQEKVECAEKILKCYFSRSLRGCDFDLRHPTFEEYAAMLLCDKHRETVFRSDVYETLCAKYGRIYDVIPMGYTHWYPPRIMHSRFYGKSQKCTVCGLGYIYPIDNRTHQAIHKKCLAAINENGFFWSNYEKTKEDGREVLRNENASFQGKFDAVETILKSYFSRSLAGTEFSPKHPRFQAYAAMLLSDRDMWKINGAPQDIYEAVRAKYGEKLGIIPLGHTHWTDPKRKPRGKKAS